MVTPMITPTSANTVCATMIHHRIGNGSSIVSAANISHPNTHNSVNRLTPSVASELMHLLSQYIIVEPLPVYAFCVYVLACSRSHCTFR